ncbi:hypothetical protein U9M48_032520 [Paspalum notatum var. saurae]|uniref:Uncharacterized protein n=1 Tax=Paspalum notatum var. saurae TaxID=547442 RepID=A0AAQ3X5H8_PASNO
MIGATGNWRLAILTQASEACATTIFQIFQEEHEYTISIVDKEKRFKTKQPPLPQEYAVQEQVLKQTVLQLPSLPSVRSSSSQSFVELMEKPFMQSQKKHSISLQTVKGSHTA